MERGQIQISFSWLFAIVVGGFILFLAIYAATQIFDASETSSSATTGKELEVFANALESSFGASQSSLLSLPVETRVENNCNAEGIFGIQGISIAEERFGEFSENNFETQIRNRYIFSEKTIQGRDLYFFTKSFDMPFKISDLSYVTDSEDNYCFINSPDDIEGEISRLNQQNFFTSECPSGSIQVCFDVSQQCDINVNTNQRFVQKSNAPGILYYEADALMYGAIFSDKEIYDCQIQRLMKRVKEISLLYQQKESLLESQNIGCFDDGRVNPALIGNLAETIEDSSQLIVLAEVSEQADTRNKLTCGLW